MLCPCCVCLWSLPPRALEHRWYSHNHCMLWNHDLASLMPSLWTSMWVYYYIYLALLLLSFRWNVSCLFWCSKRGSHFSSCLPFLKVPLLAPWSKWLLILTQGLLLILFFDPLLATDVFMFNCVVHFSKRLTVIVFLLFLQHPYHCVCRNCDSVYLFLRSSDAGKTQRVSLPRRTSLFWLVHAYVASVCFFHLWWLCVHL